MGCIYALATPSMPGLVKIGATDRDPADRLAEANASGTWGPPEPYFLASVLPVTGSTFAMERALHATLDARRVNARREFFRMTVEEVREYFAAVARAAVPAEHAPQAHVPGGTPGGTLGGTPGGTLGGTLGDTLGGTCDAPNIAASTPETKLREWVEANYTRISLREKDNGTKLEALYSAYASAAPPVHARLLGKILFAKMLNAVFPNVGPHRNGACTVSGLYLLR